MRQKELHFNFLAQSGSLLLSLTHSVTVTLAHFDSLWLSLVLSVSLWLTLAHSGLPTLVLSF